MREILFRGKRADNNEWVYGYYIVRKIWQSTVHIIRTKDNGFDSYNEYEIDPETIGQFIGLTDKNEEKIFEGDILKCFTDDFVGIVIYNKNTASFIVEIKDNNLEFYQYHYSLLNKGDITRSLQLQDTIKIGNIYNNPELLEAQDNE